jgi:hypothetical protein
MVFSAIAYYGFLDMEPSLPGVEEEVIVVFLVSLVSERKSGD